MVRSPKCLVFQSSPAPTKTITAAAARKARRRRRVCTAATGVIARRRSGMTPGTVESELLARLRQGDDEAYAAIFREHYSWLVLTASRLVGDRSLAEEVVQDVMLELWRRREEIALTGPLRAYLHQSTRNRAL